MEAMAAATTTLLVNLKIKHLKQNNHTHEHERNGSIDIRNYNLIRRETINMYTNNLPVV